MASGNSENYQSPENHQLVDRNQELIAAATQLLVAAGYKEAGAIIDGLSTAKEQSPKKDDKEDGYKFYKEKQLVYEDRDAFIYQRPDRKSAIWYFRLYDPKNNKPLVKSLKTTDKTQALVSARALYIDIKGKIERGERLKSITTPELVKEWLSKLEATITDIPHQGITPKTYKQKRSFMRRWLKYIEELGLTNITIDKIKPTATRDFANWLKILPKETCQHTGARSVEQINNNVSAVIRMYHQFAVREKYVSLDNIPQIDRLKYKIDDQFKRDIFADIEQYERYIFYLKRVYCTKKHNPDTPPEELEKRKIFNEFILILANAGFRPKELLGIKFGEIYASPRFTEEEKEKNIVMLVRRTNSKTGKERRVVAPVKKRIDRVIASYKKLGIVHEPDDYLFINAAYGRRTALGRMIMYQRLKKTLIDSGIQDELDKISSSISLYSFRHQYAYLRILNGVDFNLLAQNMGTSVARLHSTYGHVNTEQHLQEITKGQGIIKRTDTDLSVLPVIEND